MIYSYILSVLEFFTCFLAYIIEDLIGNKDLKKVQKNS